MNIIALGLELGVQVITTYALSIENLNRPKDELDGLWNLMNNKFLRILEHQDLLRKKGVALKIIGDLSLLPKHLQKLSAEISVVMANLKDPKMHCYMAICYTSRAEITMSMKKILSEVASDEGLLDASDIDDNLLQKCLYTSESKYPVDLIVRTSGETRLSDFLLWQCSDAVLYFTDIMWPEFNSWEMLKTIMYFQYCRHKGSSQGYQQELRIDNQYQTPNKERVESFVKLNILRNLDQFKRFSQIQV